MSLASKITLGSSVVFFAGSVAYAFYYKEFQRIALHKNVAKDMERQELQNRNLMELDRQIAVEGQYRAAMAKKEEETGVK